jgi:hypothetical protein
MALRAGLQAYYKFDNSGADDSKHRRAVTSFVGTEAYAAGKLGNAYTIPSSGSNYAIGTSDAVLGFTGSGQPFTISLWALRDSASNTGLLVNKFLTPGGGFSQPDNDGWALATTTSGEVGILIGGGGVNAGQQLQTGTGVFTTGSFHHVFVVSDGANISIYVNNVLEAGPTSVNEIFSAAHPVWIAMREDLTPSSFPFDGELDEIALWNRALSDAERAQLYNSGAGLSIPGLGTSVKQLNVNEPFPAFTSTVAGLPSAVGLFGHYAFVSDASGGATMAFSDNVVWRRWSDRTVVS